VVFRSVSVEVHADVSTRDAWMPSRRVPWPDSKAFAFTIFDDPDSQTFAEGREVYACLRDLGFRTTKGVWPVRGSLPASDHGITCADDPRYVDWLLSLKEAGFEIGLHNVAPHTSTREETARGLDAFADLFGHDPITLAQHYFCDENLYWGENRVGGARRLVYNLVTRGRNRGRFNGHVPGSPLFWGDLCQRRIRYVRNFVFGDINTLKACPEMPYHDPARPFVNLWYGACEGANVRSACATLSEARQERLELEGGACILYTHFGHGYMRTGKIDPRFRDLLSRLASRSGWFVPVAVLLDHLRDQRDPLVLDESGRRALEWRWLRHKVRYGTA